MAAGDITHVTLLGADNQTFRPEQGTAYLMISAVRTTANAELRLYNGSTSLNILASANLTMGLDLKIAVTREWYLRKLGVESTGFVCTMVEV